MTDRADKRSLFAEFEHRNVDRAAIFFLCRRGLKRDPVWAPLRADPRLQKLIAGSEAAMKTQAAAQSKP